MIEERAAERGVEEAVGDHIAGRSRRVQILVERQRLGVPHPHRQTLAGVIADDEPVHPAAVDLVALLVEPMPYLRGPEVVPVQRERPRAEVAAERLAARVSARARDAQRRCQKRGHRLRKTVQGAAVLIRLGRLGGQPIDAFPSAVELVEGVVLLHEDDEVIDRIQVPRMRRGRDENPDETHRCQPTHAPTVRAQ